MESTLCIMSPPELADELLKQKNLVFNWGCPDETPLTKYSEWIYSDWIEIQIKNDQFDLSLQPDEYLRDTETDDGSGVGF